MFEDIFKKIEENDVITIFGHMFPDGDCYGSSEGLKIALKHFYPNKTINVVGTDFYSIPFGYPTSDVVSDELIKQGLVIIVDLSNKARIGDPRAFTNPNIIKIDHHIFTEEFGGLEYIDTNHASCASYLAEILYTKFDHLPSLAASLFYLGITTDSGRFLYNPSKKLLNIASRLIEDGADVNYIYNKLYEVDEKSLKFKGYLYNSYKSTTLGVCYCVCNNKTLKKYGYDKNSAAGFVNSIAHIGASRMHVLFTEGEDGEVRVELRSQGDINVQEIAKKFGGGGHLNASGCRLSNLKDYKKVVNECEKAMFKTFSPYSRELKTMLKLVDKANKIIMGYYNTHFDVEIKADDSPVTSADKASNEYIRNELIKHYPHYAMLTEEDSDNLDRMKNDYLFVLDPLDGTADFVQKDDMFAINLALVYKNHPVIGIVGIPGTGEIYFAVKGKGSYVLRKGEVIKKIHVSSKKANLTGYSSYCHRDEKVISMYENSSKVTNIDYVGSSLKDCYLAEGKGEMVYTMSANTKEWDTCAPQIIVEEAGGVFMTTKGEEITYNRADVYNRDGYVALNSLDNDILNKKGE